MLKGIPDIISPELLKILHEMGHGDDHGDDHEDIKTVISKYEE